MAASGTIDPVSSRAVLPSRSRSAAALVGADSLVLQNCRRRALVALPHWSPRIPWPFQTALFPVTGPLKVNNLCCGSSKNYKILTPRWGKKTTF